MIGSKNLSFQAAFLVFVALASLPGCASLGNVLGEKPSAAETFSSADPRVRNVEEPRQRLYVVVDLDVNELRFMDGERVLWSAPVGTGTGLQLRSNAGDWDFSTPTGVFHVQYKEENPVWILPDWYFVRNNLPIPPEDSPRRKMPGALGAAAVFLGDEIAIHGTDKPELLGQRVSHGCIRLRDEDAIRLYHNVQVGTPVVITGGKHLARQAAANPAPPTNPQPQPKRVNPATRLTTEQLLRRLDQQLAAGDTSAAWVVTTNILITRGIGDDATALRGVLSRAGTSGSEKVDREYATFVADAFSRGALRAVVSLNRISKEARERAAAAIVHALLDQYPGSIHDVGAPWPTRRVPSSRLGPEGQAGWKAIRAAEQAYRERLTGTRVVMQAERE